MNFDMVCTCELDGAQAVEARRISIFQRMGLDEMWDLTPAIVMSLAFDFQAEADIYVGMWFGVSVSTPLVEEESLFVECDFPEDGLALIWEYLANRFPERVTVKTGASQTRAQSVPRISARMFFLYEDADAEMRAHHGKIHGTDHSLSDCADCNYLIHVRSILSVARSRAWGSDCLEAEVDAEIERGLKARQAYLTEDSD